MKKNLQKFIFIGCSHPHNCVVIFGTVRRKRYWQTAVNCAHRTCTYISKANTRNIITYQPLLEILHLCLQCLSERVQDTFCSSASENGSFLWNIFCWNLSGVCKNCHLEFLEADKRITFCEFWRPRALTYKFIVKLCINKSTFLSVYQISSTSTIERTFNLHFTLSYFEFKAVRKMKELCDYGVLWLGD